MYFRFALFVAVFALTACNGGWPGQTGQDPTMAEFPTVEKRWADASRAPLGSGQDAAEITSVMRKAHPDLAVREIRWLSATEVMVMGVRGDGLAIGEEDFYGVLKRSADGWRMEAWYDGSFS